MIKQKVIKHDNIQFLSQKRLEEKQKKDRKRDKDSIRKKIKGKFHKWLHQTIRTLVNFEFEVIKLPQKECITNVTVLFNKEILDITIYELYKKFTTFPNYETLKLYAEKFDYIELETFLKKTYKECFVEYMKFNYKDDLKTIKGDKEYLYNYDLHATSLVDYYTKKYPNKV